ncbi:MAG TPA: FAD-binding protein [Gemmatimonadaceae bacterium]|nr:FAD-binding protein [Gemmatimonadaceae bacterium]
MTAQAAAVGTVRDRILEARELREPVRITGAGRWQDAGRPVRAARTIDLRNHAGIVEYVPGDLTLTAGAGTSLAEIARITGAERQWLPLDPFGSAEGTLGATVATASCGPLAHAFGSPRDQVLGLETVTGTGDVVRTGGRVVKNVAGFDLTRLFTGSWGTLAVLTEVTVRLRALPAAEAHLAVTVPDASVAGVAALARAARALRAEPYALELVNRALALRLGLPPAAALLVRLGGNDASVAAQRDAVGALGHVVELQSGVWSALRAAEPSGAAVVRLPARPSDVAQCWGVIAAAAPDALVHATLGRGTVRAILPAADEGGRATALLAFAHAAPRWVGERLPAALWTEIDDVLAARPVSDDAARSHRARVALVRRIKDTYDPMHLLNPGILGEAIA